MWGSIDNNKENILLGFYLNQRSVELYCEWTIHPSNAWHKLYAIEQMTMIIILKSNKKIGVVHSVVYLIVGMVCQKVHLYFDLFLITTESFNIFEVHTDGWTSRRTYERSASVTRRNFNSAENCKILYYWISNFTHFRLFKLYPWEQSMLVKLGLQTSMKCGRSRPVVCFPTSVMTNVVIIPNQKSPYIRATAPNVRRTIRTRLALLCSRTNSTTRNYKENSNDDNKFYIISIV